MIATPIQLQHDCVDDLGAPADSCARAAPESAVIAVALMRPGRYADPFGVAAA
ncbi:MAG: hypothetical protein AB7R00_27820 [Kofleriaceae bacterium]